MARPSSELIRPFPPMRWAQTIMPTTPTDFEIPLPRLPTIRFLEVLNAHPRDSRLRFFAEDHKYTWDGRPTLGSVTGLIHHFCHPFNEDQVIERMREGRNWPRVGYMAIPTTNDVIEGIRGSPFAAHLINLLLADEPNEHAIAAEAQRLRHLDPRIRSPLIALGKTKQAIKHDWEINRNRAANAGTWMHWTLEAFVNRAIHAPISPEFDLFMRMMPQFAGLVAYRTEWTVYADHERLAGSIDFVAKHASGELVLFDWKRSKALRTKYVSFGRQQMQSPLEDIPDAQGQGATMVATI